MAQHTPGPWRYWTQRRQPEDTCTFRNIEGVEVLRAVTVTLTEADARLIAAAPDLLDALNEISLMWHADGIVLQGVTREAFEILMERVEVLTLPFRRSA